MKYLLAVAAALLCPVGADAAAYVEINAGQTLGTAEAVGPAGVTVDTITGTLSALQDADLFRIYIMTPSTFSATTLNAGTNDATLDTALFLFDSAGRAVATNDDDAGGLSLQATLPVGNAFYAGLTAGYYYLGIGNSGNEPVNLNNQLLFARDPNGGTTAVRGPAGGVTPVALFDFDSNAYDGNGAGAYRIVLTGVTTGPGTPGGVPEPASWAMMIAGFGVIGGSLRRRSAAVGFRLA